MHKKQHFRGKATARKRRKLLTVHELIFTLDLFNLWEIILHPSHHIILLLFSALPPTFLHHIHLSLHTISITPPTFFSLPPHHLHHYHETKSLASFEENHTRIGTNYVTPTFTNLEKVSRQAPWKKLHKHLQFTPPPYLHHHHENRKA